MAMLNNQMVTATWCDSHPIPIPPGHLQVAAEVRQALLDVRQIKGWPEKHATAEPTEPTVVSRCLYQWGIATVIALNSP